MPLISKAVLEVGARAVEELFPAEAAALKSNKFVESAVHIATEARDLLSAEASAILSSPKHASPSLGRLLRNRDSANFDFTAVPTRFLSEDKSVSIDVLSADQLFERVNHQKKNADLFKTKIVDGEKVRRLHYLNVSDAADQIHVTLSQNQRIIGVSGLQTNPGDPRMLWVQHISVEKQHQNQGFAARLIESVYDYANSKSQVVVPSSFTKDGQRLKHIFDRLDMRYPEAASKLPHEDF